MVAKLSVHVLSVRLPEKYSKGINNMNDVLNFVHTGLCVALVFLPTYIYVYNLSSRLEYETAFSFKNMATLETNVTSWLLFESKISCFATDFNLIYLSLEGEYSLSNLADDIRFVAQQMPNDVATR